MALLDIYKLVVRFGGLTAVCDLDYSVEKGRIAALIGPNGAGKTTVFNAITGIYEPTEGRITFGGHDLRRPMTAHVVLACALIGLALGLAGMLFSAGLDPLWRATINREYAVHRHDFSWQRVLVNARTFFRGDLAAVPARGGRYGVETFDGHTVLAFAPNAEQAAKLVAGLQQLFDAPSLPAPIERGGRWAIVTPQGEPILDFDTEETAHGKLNQIATAAEHRRSHLRWIVFGLVAGLVVGTAGPLVVWQRSRRTPDVIARGGIARTFQNIRLFRSMTARDNVLVGMDRGIGTSLIAMLLHTPGFWREEVKAAHRADALMEFIGLSGKENMLAQNMAYGDQRRLEIARALATDPQLILLDEPAAGMNPTETSGLMELIRRVRERGVTVLLIEHHMKLVMGISEQIAVLDYGAKIAEGTPDEVRKNPKVVEAYLGREATA